METQATQVVEPQVIKQNGFKLVSDKQRQLIEQLLQSSRVEKTYKRYVRRALKNTVSSFSASKIIAFLVALITFKKDFIRPYHLKDGTRKSWKQKEMERATAEMAMCDKLEAERWGTERAEQLYEVAPVVRR